MPQNKILIGKDVLRLITLAMYDNPLVIYREYIQNAVDSFDSGLAFNKKEVYISFDVGSRSIEIRDIGSGISASKFETQMKNIGQSEKRQTNLRGLWGIGRLGGLAYCQEVVFTTKAPGEGVISQIKWDGCKFREILQNPDYSENLTKIIDEITEVKTRTCNKDDLSFFEVQLNGVIRHGNDILFNEDAVQKYLSQVAPVPFHPDIPFREKIEGFLSRYIDVSGYHIFLNGNTQSICRPYKGEFAISQNEKSHFTEIDCFEANNGNGKPLIIGWMLHHDYFGSLKYEPTIRGLRVRRGNMQIGNERLLAEVFPEERFNSWMVGEIHVIDENIKPNGKRDGFENTNAYRDLKTKLVSLVGRPVAKMCRDNSSARNSTKRILEQIIEMEISLDIISTGLLSPDKIGEILNNIRNKMALFEEEKKITTAQKQLIERKIKNIKKIEARYLKKIPKTQQKLVNDITGLVYENANSPKVAEKLINEIKNYLNH